MNIRPFYHILTNLDTGVEKTLTSSPIDWADLTKNIFRHEVYKTVLFEETLSQRFSNVGGSSFDHGGYWFLKSAYEASGVKARVKYERKTLNPFTNDYDDDFVGAIDFSSDSGLNYTDEYFEVKTIDSSKLAKFLSRDEIEYNVFSLVSTDNVTVPDFVDSYKEVLYPKIDIPLQCTSNGFFFGTENFTINNVGVNYALFPYWADLTKNEIGDRIVIGTQPPVNGIIYNNSSKQDSSLISSAITYDTSFSIDFVVTGTIIYTYNVYFIMRVFNAGGAQISENATVPIVSASGSTTQTINVSDSGTAFFFLAPEIDVPEGGRAEFYFGIRVNTTTLLSGSVETTVILDNSITYTQISEYNFYEKTEGWPNNNIRGLFTYEAFTRLLQLATSETDTSKLLQSEILGRTDSEFQTYVSNGELSLDFITNGYQLRQFVDRSLNISIKDLFQSLNAVKPIGLWYDKTNDIFVIEEIEQFFKAELMPFHLGEVKDLSVEPADYYNLIQGGYPKIETEDFQGVNVVNTETEHTISIETKSKSINRAPYYSGSIPEELARRKNISKFASEDTKYDDIIFIDRTNGTQVIQGELTISGIENGDQYYNLTKTPRQNLIRQQLILNAPLFKDASENIKFNKSIKDTNISYVDPTEGVTVNEFDDIPQLVEPLYYPELYKFEAPYLKEVKDAIKIDPHRIIPFYDKYGNELYGYIWEIEANEYKQIAQWTLIRVNENRIP